VAEREFEDKIVGMFIAGARVAFSNLARDLCRVNIRKNG
jgi:hypothetical protein